MGSQTAADINDQGQGIAVPLQRLLRNQFLRAANPDRRVVLPVHNLETSIPKMGSMPVVAFEELPDMLTFNTDVPR